MRTADMNTRLNALVVIGLLIPATTLQAQDAPPATEIYLADVASDGRIGQAVNISQHAGYDNQPAFSKDGQTIWFTRFDDGQTDIWA